MTDTQQVFGRVGNELKAGYIPLKDTEGTAAPLDVTEGAREIGARRPPF